ncbi:hypothetical protein BGX38DRAFT_511381 [Terfezia claveryi]|nr:hypothetical protein BGX38DRAFT_511381 [Terfezia claveryi]
MKDSAPRRFFLNISQVYTDLHEASSKVSLDIAKYCDVSHRQTLPFLFAGQFPTERFYLDENRHFEFYGQELSRNLYDAAKSMYFLRTRRYFLHGTLGAGKSHLLAALTCVLRKEGMRVVYLPDCRGLLDNPFQYLRHALRLAFF